MSLNLYLTITITGYDVGRAAGIGLAVRGHLEREGIDESWHIFCPGVRMSMSMIAGGDG